MLRDFTKEEFDIILQAGQSNSEGCGAGDATTPYMQRDDVLYFNYDFTICTAQERVWQNDIVSDFSLSFSTKYIEEGKLAPGRKLLIIRAAVGGTGFLDNRWKLKDDLFLRMMDMTKTALELNTNNKLVAFLWHQGENDAGARASKETHYNNLKTLVDTVRSTFGCPNLPFVTADFVQQWKMANIEACTPVIEAIQDVCANIGNAQFIQTSELQSNAQKNHGEDDIHFCREALNQLGIKYYQAFCNIINK